VRSLVEREVALHRHLNQNSNRVTFMLGVHLDDTDAVFTAMELCGESLAQWLQNAPGGQVSRIPAQERMAAAAALTAAVADVHAAGVTHNDIKPDNCLRAATGEFKLADLGLGVRMKAADRGGDSQFSMNTFAGYGVNVQMQGRPPEVLQGSTLTSAVDVWSLGCLVYAVLTGHRSPFMVPEETGKDADADGSKGNKSTMKKTPAQVNTKHTWVKGRDSNAKSDNSAGDKSSNSVKPVAGDAGIQALYENQRIINNQFILFGLETANLPAHTAVAARHALHDMLQADPADRPTATELSRHPIFWSPARAVEAVREVFDARLMPTLTLEEEQNLMGDVWGGELGRRYGRGLQGWKDKIIPELLERAILRGRIKALGFRAGKVKAAGSASEASPPIVTAGLRGRKKGKLGTLKSEAKSAKRRGRSGSKGRGGRRGRGGGRKQRRDRVRPDDVRAHPICA